MDLSVIIVSWNAKAFLVKCLQSLVQEMAQYDAEIIVVDNASTDGSAELVKEEFPYVKLIRNNANLGFAKANNIGIRESTGKYLCLLNSDIEVVEKCFFRLMEHMEQNSKIGMIGPQILNPNGTIERSTMRFPTLWNIFCRALALDSLFPQSELFASYLMISQKCKVVQNVDVLNGCFWMIQKESLKQVGLLDERFFIYAEDIDWCKRFWAAGWQVVYFPYAEGIHYGGASSSQAPIKFYIEMHRANLKYWKKHHGRPAQIGFLLITGLHQIIRLVGEMVRFVIKPEKRSNSAFKMKRSIACIQWIAGSHC